MMKQRRLRKLKQSLLPVGLKQTKRSFKSYGGLAKSYMKSKIKQHKMNKEDHTCESGRCLFLFSPIEKTGIVGILAEAR